MKTLKYLKLFEAFESEALSKVLKYIKRKIDSKNYEKFLSSLRELFLSNYDIQLSKISDNSIKYLPAKVALKVQTEGQIMNPFGVYALKFWFSLTKGYLGITAVGITDGEESYGLFSKKEIDHLKNEGLETGVLIPITDYGKLKHGDSVVAVFNDYENRISGLSLARIFIEGDNLFAIQNVSDGGRPSNSSSWRNWGLYSWNLGPQHGRTSDDFTDHHKLHKYEPSDEPLHSIISNVLYSESFIDKKGYITSEYSKRSDEYIDFSDLIVADFAVVVYLDEIVIDEPVSDIKKIRTKEKEGATALLSNEEIKELNYQRYFNRMIEMHGLTKNSVESDLKNLQNMVKNLVAGELIVFGFYSDDPEIGLINKITDDIRNLIDEEDKEYYLNQLSNRYESGKKIAEKYKKVYIRTFQRVKDSSDKKTLVFFNNLFEISKLIYTKIKDSEVESIGDLMILKRKLISIREFFLEVQGTYFCEGIVKALKNFRYDDIDVNRGIELAKSESNIDKDMKGLEIFEKFVNKVFS